jgi:WD40 repeat protein
MLFTPDGKSLVTVGFTTLRKGRADEAHQPSAAVWDVATQKVQQTILFPEGVGGPGPDGKALIVGRDAALGDRLGGVAVTPDGKTLIVGTGCRRLELYDLSTGKRSGPVEIDKEADKPLPDVSASALSPDGKTLALGTKSGAILVWDLEKGTTRHTIQASRANAPPPGLLVFPNLPDNSPIDLLTFSPDGKMLASYAQSDSKVDLWDPATGKNIDFLRPDPWLSRASALAFSPDGKTLAFGGRRGSHSVVELWDLAASGFRADFEGESKGYEVQLLAFSPDGKTLVAGARTNPVEFWDVPAGKPKDVKPFVLTPEQLKAIRGR